MHSCVGDGAHLGELGIRQQHLQALKHLIPRAIGELLLARERPQLLGGRGPHPLPTSHSFPFTCCPRGRSTPVAVAAACCAAAGAPVSAPLRAGAITAATSRPAAAAAAAREWQVITRPVFY